MPAPASQSGGVSGFWHPRRAAHAAQNTSDARSDLQHFAAQRPFCSLSQHQIFFSGDQARHLAALPLSGRAP